MRVVQKKQMLIGEVDISKIKFDLKSRDDIPKILKGLQHLYINEPLRIAIFILLESQIAPKINKNNGRPGMTLWDIFVCGVIRLDLNCDYDRLHELVNKHLSIREILGHGIFDDVHYNHQTLKDNVRLLTPDLLDEINQLIVQEGHVLVKKNGDEPLRGRCDSFVVETHVHFPTDINLLYDAMSKVITLTGELCENLNLSEWRQYLHNVKQVKRLMRTAQNKKRSNAKSPELIEKKETLVVQSHKKYLDFAQFYVDKAIETLINVEKQGLINESHRVKITEINGYIQHATRQIDQTHRRVILGEVIPHDEKVFSIFQPHTEWISKGKIGVPVELGVKVCILEDQYQFILHHQVMQNQTDDKVTVEMVTNAKKKFPLLNACSFDKGFHSKSNQTKLKETLDLVALPRKGRLSKLAQEEEQTEAFIKARRAHSAVESAINGLEVHGLDICPDHGIDGFKRYVALAVVARNIHRIGAILWQQKKECEKRKIANSHQDPKNRLVA